jgi:hypothetical protein
MLYVLRRPAGKINKVKINIAKLKEAIQFLDTKNTTLWL